MEDKAVKKIISFIIVTLIVVSFCQVADAQVSRDYWLNRMPWTIDASGTEWTSDWLSTSQNSPAIWYDWQPWPSYENDIGYHGVDINSEALTLDGHGKTLHGAIDYWVGSTNWTAPAAGTWGPDGAEAIYTPGITYPVFVNDNGPVTLNGLVNTPEVEDGFALPKSFYRIDMPVISLDNVAQQPISFDPIGNAYVVDPDLPSDGHFQAKWNDPMGLTFMENRYVYSHPDYDRITIWEITITNDGDANGLLPGLEKPGQSLTDFWLGFTSAIGDVRFTEFPEDSYYNGEVDWLLDYDPVNRYYWAWDGDAQDWAGDDQFDPRGGPIATGITENPTGEFTAPEVTGYCIIHAPQYPGGPDDPNQPATFRYRKYQDMKSPANGDDMTEAWNWMTGGDGADMYQKGFSDNPYQPQTVAQPHWAPIAGIGPYNVGPNESIKLVYAFAIGHISEARCIELGQLVKNGSMSLADAKREIYEGGRDDLFTLFERAKDLYLNKNLVAPKLPDPPTNIVIMSGPEQVSMTWDAVSGADKYRVYRAIGGVDNGRVYQMVHETTNTSYTDEGLVRGINYFYNIVSVKGDLESNKFFTRINKEAVPFRSPPETADWVDKVRVVPNPINVKGNTYVESAGHNTTGFNFDGGNREQNTLLFVNLPAECTIRIYDSGGLLVKTLEHTSGTADERWSPIITEDNVTPASGIYFYTIEANSASLAGQVATGKLVIVR